MQRVDILKKQRDRLKEDISAHLDSFLIGTIAKSPSMTGHGLTTKVKGKTVSLYVRKEMVRRAQEMATRYKTNMASSAEALEDQLGDSQSGERIGASRRVSALWLHLSLHGSLPSSGRIVHDMGF